MITFAGLSREEHALYNPALTALLVGRAVQGHEQQYSAPSPIAVAILSTVMALQPSIRAALPKTTGSGIVRWAEENKLVRASNMQNASTLSRVVRPGLSLALQRGLVTVTPTGRLVVPPRVLPKSIAGDSDDLLNLQKAAFFLGRWLPSSGNLSTIMTLLGVRP